MHALLTGSKAPVAVHPNEASKLGSPSGGLVLFFIEKMCFFVGKEDAWCFFQSCRILSDWCESTVCLALLAAVLVQLGPLVCHRSSAYIRLRDILSCRLKLRVWHLDCICLQLVLVELNQTL